MGSVGEFSIFESLLVWIFQNVFFENIGSWKNTYNTYTESRWARVLMRFKTSPRYRSDFNLMSTTWQVVNLHPSNSKHTGGKMEMQSKKVINFLIHYFFSDLHQGIAKLDPKWVSKSTYQMSFSVRIVKISNTAY